MNTFKKGDKVTWNTPQGKTEGEVVSKLQHNTELGGKEYKASSDKPKYKVQSSKSDKVAIHAATSLKKDK